jgi:hypothetical protein
MPPDVRQKYEKAMASINSNMQATTSGQNTTDQVISTIMKFVVAGREFSRLEYLPPDARAKYEKVMGMLDKNANGIPDFVEGMNIDIASPVSVQANASQQPVNSPLSAPIPASPAIAPDTYSGWMLVLLGARLLTLCLAGAAGL